MVLVSKTHLVARVCQKGNPLDFLTPHRRRRSSFVEAEGFRPMREGRLELRRPSLLVQRLLTAGAGWFGFGREQVFEERAVVHHRLA
jgi:hypothetical protein